MITAQEALGPLQPVNKASYTVLRWISLTQQGQPQASSSSPAAASAAKGHKQ